MDTYVEDLLKFTNTTGESATPATARLFVIGEGEKLGEDEAEYFHSVVAKLLYLAKRTMPDLLTATGFLSKRLLCSTKTDMLKLERVLKYLVATS